ncbi:unnamed protein product [Lepeophtheirus salmonis]|uniref:(salmon louse) hypothetical protein n=1 Tax=Lepeophtheirus salmonis TaxID=72036 RepID=A0A7R8H4D6_LEPSM|nr:unnamed protein product [Lepeophtheirus salmonis]CAF2845864.1 unnamed protein product [Lepeophtheirus salmonis]
MVGIPVSENSFLTTTITSLELGALLNSSIYGSADTILNGLIGFRSHKSGSFGKDVLNSGRYTLVNISFNLSMDKVPLIHLSLMKIYDIKLSWKYDNYYYLDRKRGHDVLPAGPITEAGIHEVLPWDLGAHGINFRRAVGRGILVPLVLYAKKKVFEKVSLILLD